MATLGVTGVGAYFGTRGSSKPEPVKPSKNVPDKEEEAFIRFARFNSPAQQSRLKPVGSS